MKSGFFLLHIFYFFKILILYFDHIYALRDVNSPMPTCLFCSKFFWTNKFYFQSHVEKMGKYTDTGHESVE